MKTDKLRYFICLGTLGLLLNSFCCRAQSHSLGVNVPMLAFGSINFELSKALSQKTTLHLPLSWNPMTFGNNKKIKHFMLQPGVRWWKWHTYSGYFGGINITAIQFNAGIKTYRYYGKGAGITLSAGYAKMISKEWNIEAEAGVYSGWVSYDKYQRRLCGDYEGSWRGFKFFPAKISLSLIYIM